jgi:hypothetical protein
LKCNKKLSEIIQNYRELMMDFTMIIQTRDAIQHSEAKQRCAYAIYLATYFHPLNKDCILLLGYPSDKFLGVETLNLYS